MLGFLLAMVTWTKCRFKMLSSLGGNRSLHYLRSSSRLGLFFTGFGECHAAFFHVNIDRKRSIWPAAWCALPTLGIFMRSTVRGFSIAALMLLFVFSGSLAAQDIQRGYKNYQDIINGRKKLEQLSRQEQQEVLLVNKRLQAISNGDKSAECRDAISRAESSASELANYARRLRNCAEAQDYSDDCSTEFRRTRNAQSDYESAVSSVGSYCR
jgi:hypothetical protein